MEAAQASTNPDRPVANISTLVIRLNRTVTSLETLLTDPKLQGQVRTIAQNLAEASAQLKTTLAAAESTFKNADTTVNRFGETAQQANATLQVTQKQILRVPNSSCRRSTKSKKAPARSPRATARPANSSTIHGFTTASSISPKACKTPPTTLISC